MRRFLPALVIVVLASLVFGYLQSKRGVEEDGRTQMVTLAFYDQNDLDTASGEASKPMTREVRESSNMADTALRLLFEGPTDEEYADGARTTPDLSRLKDTYIDVTVKDGLATANFEPGALAILNSAAARQGQVKVAIEDTLKALPGITGIEYAIDGAVFTEWDA